jgi:16S rRNA (guanine966-N2)-methyltransferase
MARAARLRVIAGSARGRRLVAPAGTAARPTTDRVKESFFSALGDDRFADATVLDLYAGSGALGIEALSRGAARAVLVDHDRAAADAIERNVEATGFSARARVRRQDVAAFAQGPPPAEAPFDVVFLDPPYALATSELGGVFAGLARPGWLAPAATVVVERARTADLPPWPPGWATTWERSYGDTLVSVALTEQLTEQEE